MARFTLHRNYILRSTNGRSVEFRKGEPTYVPPLCVQEAISIGAVPEEGMDSVDPEKQEKATLTPEQRKAAVFAAFTTMAGRGERADYSASGVPNIKRLPALTGFELTTTERDTFWAEFRGELQDQKDQAELDARIGT